MPDNARATNSHGKVSMIEQHIDRKAAEREQQDAPPPEMVRQIAEHRRGEEGCDRHHQPDPRADLDCARQVDPPDLHHQLWQHGHDDAETHRIHENRRDDEWNGACCRHLFFTLTVISATEPALMRCR